MRINAWISDVSSSDLIALVHQAYGFHAWPGYGERGSTDEIGFGYDLAGIESGLDGLSGCDRISPSRPARKAGPVQQLKPVGAKIIADHRAQHAAGAVAFECADHCRRGIWLDDRVVVQQPDILDVGVAQRHAHADIVAPGISEIVARVDDDEP